MSSSEPQPVPIAKIRFLNPSNPSTWSRKARHAIINPSRHSRTHLQMTRHLKGVVNCQYKRHLGEDVENRRIKDTSGTRPRSGHISKARTPRGHAHRQGISETWTPTLVGTGPRSTPLGHGHLQKDTWTVWRLGTYTSPAGRAASVPNPNSTSATLYLYLSTSPRLFSHLGFLFMSKL